MTTHILLILLFSLVMCDVSFVNSVTVIAQNPKVTAINSCIEVDITGQVVSDSIGNRMYSGESDLVVVIVIVMIPFLEYSIINVSISHANIIVFEKMFKQPFPLRI